MNNSNIINDKQFQWNNNVKSKQTKTLYMRFTFTGGSHISETKYFIWWIKTIITWKTWHNRVFSSVAMLGKIAHSEKKLCKFHALWASALWCTPQNGVQCKHSIEILRDTIVKMATPRTAVSTNCGRLLRINFMHWNTSMTWTILTRSTRLEMVI